MNRGLKIPVILIFIFLQLVMIFKGHTLAEWERQNPQPHDYTVNDIWGSSGNDVFTVGDYGTVFHYDGLSWNPIESSTRRK